MGERRSREEQDLRALLFWIGRLEVLHEFVCTRGHLPEDAFHLFVETFDFLLQGVNLCFVGRRDFLLILVRTQNSLGLLLPFFNLILKRTDFLRAVLELETLVSAARVQCESAEHG